MNLKKIFDPESVAVIGVSSSNPFHPANVIFIKNKLRLRNRTYCVSPRGGELYGDPVYRSLHEIPEKVDLAVLGIRADLVPETLEGCIAAGVGGAIIISGGFAETGQNALQDRVINLSAEHDFPVIGPNCLGVYSPPRLDTFFLPFSKK